MDTIATMEPLNFKQIEKDTSLTQCLHVITKNNTKQFEVQGKEDVVEIKKAK